MMLDDAIKQAEQYQSVLRELVTAASRAKRAEALDKENVTLRNRIQNVERELEVNKRTVVILSSILRQVHEIEICRVCNGAGGHETEEGGAPCYDCNETGYVKIDKGAKKE